MVKAGNQMMLATEQVIQNHPIALAVCLADVICFEILEFTLQYELKLFVSNICVIASPSNTHSVQFLILQHKECRGTIQKNENRNWRAGALH